MFNISRFRDTERHEYECDVVTPLFLGSADPRKAELRVPPIKGVLRFWWRALHPQATRNLKDGESKLFGDAGEQYGKSNLILAIKDQSITGGQYQPLPHQTAPPRNFKVNNISGTFKIVIEGKREHHTLFELFCLLGGIGKRSRRGFGSISLVNVDGKSYTNSANLETIYNLINVLSKNEFTLTKHGISRNRAITGINYAYLKEIKMGRSIGSVDELLKRIGKVSHEHNSDYTGFAKGQKRFASPVYVSVKKSGHTYVPVISLLNTAFEVSTGHGPDKSNDFVEAVINMGGAQ